MAGSIQNLRRSTSLISLHTPLTLQFKGQSLGVANSQETLACKGDDAEDVESGEMIKARSQTEESTDLLSKNISELSIEETKVAEKDKHLKRNRHVTNSPPPCPPTSEVEEESASIENKILLASTTINAAVLPNAPLHSPQNKGSPLAGLACKGSSAEDPLKLYKRPAAFKEPLRKKTEVGRDHSPAAIKIEENKTPVKKFVPPKKKKLVASSSATNIGLKRFSLSNTEERVNHLIHLNHQKNCQIERMQTQILQLMKVNKRSARAQMQITALQLKLEKSRLNESIQLEARKQLQKEFFLLLFKMDKIQKVLGKRNLLTGGECKVISKFVMDRHVAVQNTMKKLMPHSHSSSSHQVGNLASADRATQVPSQEGVYKQKKTAAINKSNNNPNFETHNAGDLNRTRHISGGIMRKKVCSTGEAACVRFFPNSIHID